LAPAKEARGGSGLKPIAEVGRGTVGPFLAALDDGWLAIWSGADGEGGFSWFSLVLNAEGRAVGSARRVAASSEGVRLVQVRPIDGGALISYTVEGDDNSQVAFLPVGDGGQVRGSPVELSQSMGRVIWVDSTPVDGGALVFWGVRDGDHAVLSGARWQPEEGLGSTRILHSDAKGWQVAGGGAGALLAVANQAGDIELLSLDAAGEVAETTSLASSGHAQGDLDLIPTARGFVVAYTSLERIEPQVMSAVVGSDGRALTHPTPAVDPFGEQALVDLIAGDHGYLVWHNVAQEPDMLRIAALDAVGRATGKQRLVPLDARHPPPEFAARKQGPSVLLWSCAGGSECSAPRPTLLDFGRQLDPLGTRRWEFGGQAPDLAWHLTCREQACLALAARFGDPTQVFARGTEGYDDATLVLAAPGESPLDSLEAVIETEPLADLAIAPSADGTLLSWLTFFEPSTPYDKPTQPAPDGRLAPVRALLKTLWLDDEGAIVDSGQRDAEPEVISYRARSVSGISLASKADRHLLAWSAIDGKQPQVFTTVLGKRGEKIAQRMQTRAKGEVHTVRAAPTEKGWLLSWIDTRTGQGKTYVALLDERLNKKSRELQMPQTQGVAQGLDAVTLGDRAWLLTTEQSPAGKARLQLLVVEAGRLKPIAPETTLADGAREISSASLLAHPSGVWAAWIEDQGEGARVMLRALDENGSPRGPARSVDIEGEPLQLGSRCNQAGCRLVIQGTREGYPIVLETALDGPEAVTLLRLRSRSAARLAGVGFDDQLWLYDTMARGQGIFRAHVREAKPR
jgi:hypothetical protein